MQSKRPSRVFSNTTIQKHQFFSAQPSLWSSSPNCARPLEKPYQCRKVKSESEVAQSCLTLSDPWTAGYQAPPPMGFSRQEYCSGVPLPSECRRIDAFELLCWRRLLRVPWTARRSNQSILKEISPGCSLKGLMLKLKLQCLAT